MPLKIKAMKLQKNRLYEKQTRAMFPQKTGRAGKACVTGDRSLVTASSACLNFLDRCPDVLHNILIGHSHKNNKNAKKIYRSNITNIYFKNSPGLCRRRISPDTGT